MRVLFVVLVCFAACTPDHYEAKARIIERKMLPDSQLMLRYTYTVGDKVIIDSVTTQNRIIPHDSLTVIYSSSSPERSEVKFQ